MQYTKRPPILSTWWDLRRMQQKAIELHRAIGFQLVHCRSYIPAIAGLRLKRKFGVPMLFDMRGFWADERREGGLWNDRKLHYRLIYRYFKRWERRFLAEADHTVSLTEAGKEVIHSWTHIPSQPIPISVIPCCADLQLFHSAQVDPEKREQRRAELGLSQEGITLVYLGSIGTWYLLSEMLDFFAVLRQSQPQAQMLFVTREPAEKILTKAAERSIPESAIAITPAERPEVPTLLSLADAGLFFILPVFSKTASSPTKQGEMMGMGLPVICNTGVGDTDRIIRDYNAGLLVEKFRPQHYTPIAHQLPDFLSNADPDAIRQGAEAVYSLEAGAETYRQIYAHLIYGEAVPAAAKNSALVNSEE
jgi:glycosyltransferase involved in cell wall biosynthesis